MHAISPLANAGDSLEAGSVGGDVTLDRIQHQRLKLNTVGGDVTYAALCLAEGATASSHFRPAALVAAR